MIELLLNETNSKTRDISSLTCLETINNIVYGIHELP
jgi:hypothetical protein